MKKQILSKDFLFYIPAFIMPVITLTLFRLLYTAGYGQAYAGTLSVTGIFLSGLASVSMLFYFKKSGYNNLTYPFSLFLSAFYGLSSHILLPSFEFGSQLSASLFPILVFAFEAFVFHRKCLMLILLLSLYLSLDTITASTLMIGFLFAFFFMSHSSKGRLIADFCHLLLIYALSVCISGMFSLPAYRDFFTAASSYSYPGFMLNMPFPNFISRLLTGAVPTFYYDASISNTSLYFGIFSFLLFVLYFFHNEISFRKRIKNLIFLCIILCALEFSSMQYIFELFSATKPAILYFECIFIFWGLKLAGELFPLLPRFKPLNLFLGLFCSFAVIFYGFSGSYLNFHSVALLSGIIFLSLYIVCILVLWKAPRLDFIKTLLYCLLPLELICNIFLVTNENIFPATAISETNYIWKNHPEEEISPVPSSAAFAATEDAYHIFYEEHTDLVLINRINTLLSEVGPDETDIELYNRYDQLNMMEKANAACRKIGADADLFIPSGQEAVFSASGDYSISAQGGNVYNLYQYASAEANPVTYIHYEFPSDPSKTLIIYNSLTGTLQRFDPDINAASRTGYIYSYPSNSYSYNFRLLGYYMNTDVYEALPDLLVAYTQSQLSSASYMGIYYAGIILTCAGVLICALFFFNRDKNAILRALNSLKEKLSMLSLWEKIDVHIKNNYVYYLALAIPVLLYLLTMIIFSCIPFGSYSFYDEDGISASLPSILSAYYNIKDKDTLFTMIGGYGYSPYSINTVFFYRALLVPFAARTIPVLILFLEGLLMGLTSFSMVYYLTHRLSGTSACKTDYRLLIPAFIYSLNTYVLAMHGFPTWYYAFFLLPLLLLAMDRLMYQKSWGLYTLMLALCIFFNFNLSIFICLFLVIWFFTYRFDSIKDFFQKGIRFAFASLAAGGCSFYKLLETFSSKTASLYQESDNILPTFGFHTSFFEQWKQLFIFSPSMAVTQDDGYINLYMGILMLLLLGIYLTSKRISLKDKLRRLLPAAILVLSFNEQVLSYIWNGFHYQTNVPNRYVFLFMFLCALTAYDAVRELRSVSLQRFLGISGLLLVFLVLCHLFSEDVTKAFVCSVCLVILYGFLHILSLKLSRAKFPYCRILCAVLLFELSANMFYTTSRYNLFSYTFIDSFDEVGDYASSQLYPDGFSGRVSTPGAFQINTGMIYNLPSASFFNSFISPYQTMLHYCYGFLSGTNYNTYNYNSTPLGMALSGHKYVFVPFYTSIALKDNTYYDYIGSCGNYFVYEVPDTLSLGFYVPESILEMPEDADTALSFQNELVSLYTETPTPVYDIHRLSYSDDVENTPDSFCFLDKDKNPVPPEEAQQIIRENAGTSMMFCIRDLYLYMNLAPGTDAEAYLYLNEFIPLGKSHAQTPLITDIPYPNPTPLTGETEFVYATFDEEVFARFMETASENQMENTVVDNNHITGTTHYEKDGYTMLSMAYDAGWSAYIDGNKVPIYAPYNSFMMFETPAGDHQIELVYERPGVTTGILITIICMVLTVLAYGFQFYFKKKRLSNESRFLPT